MPLTPDRRPGVSDEEGVNFEDIGEYASAPGQLRYHNGRMSMYDSAGEYDPRTGGASFDDIVLDEQGRVVYIGDGQFVMRV
jgi:hypothetical protein